MTPHGGPINKSDSLYQQRRRPAQFEHSGGSRLLCLAPSLALFILATCGGEKPEPLALTLVAQDIRFDVNTLTVKAGQPVVLTYTNEGVIDHSLQIDGVLAKQKVRPGQTQRFRGMSRLACWAC